MAAFEHLRARLPKLTHHEFVYSIFHLKRDPIHVTPTFLCSLLAFGLALALARENRLRRAFQDLVSRLLAKLRESDRRSSHPHQSRHSRRPS